MKQYKRIGHQKTYQAHQFCYEKIELSEDFPIDKPDEECFRELLERIEAMAKVAYPWLYEEEKTFAWSSKFKFSPEVPYGLTVEAPPLMEKIVEDQPEEKPLLQLIQESESARELESWKLLIQVEKDEVKKRELFVAYEQKMDVFKNGKLKGDKA
jgi:hypothetical protein